MLFLYKRMRKKYHTLEEMRKALAVRQARWREKNRGYERIRAKNNYDKRRAGGDGAPADSDREEVREGATGTDGEAVVHGGRVGDRGIGGRGKAIGKGETYTGPIEGVDTAYGGMEPKANGGRGGVSILSQWVAWDKRERTAEEERVAEQLAAFKARRAGVQVELIL
jgi:hypothetical protein